MVETKDIQQQVTIIFGPVMALLRSRKFMTAVIGLFVMWLVGQVPSLAPYQAELILAISVIASVIVGGIAHEDAAKTKAAATEAAARTQAENIQSAIEAAIETFYTKQNAQRALVEALPGPSVEELTRATADLVTARLIETTAPGEPAAG